MPYTSDHKEVSKDLASEVHGKQEASASQTTKAHNHKDKVLDKPLSIPLQLQSHGTISQLLWTSTGQEPQEEIGEDTVEGSQEETLPEQMIQGPKEEYRVHALTVVNKDTLLTIAPQSRNTPICEPLSSLIGPQRTMKATQK